MHHREALRVLAESSKLRKLPLQSPFGSSCLPTRHGHRSSNLHEAQTFGRSARRCESLLALWRAVNWCVIGRFAVGLAERAFSTKPWLTLKRCGHICERQRGLREKGVLAKAFGSPPMHRPSLDAHTCVTMLFCKGAGAWCDIVLWLQAAKHACFRGRFCSMHQHNVQPERKPQMYAAMTPLQTWMLDLVDNQQSWATQNLPCAPRAASFPARPRQPLHDPWC